MTSYLKSVLTPRSTPAATPEASRPSTPTTWVRKLPKQKDIDALSAAQVPLVTLADCQGCDAGDEEPCQAYPRNFDVDLTSDLLGSIKGFRRLAICGTGKTDWPHDVTESKQTLAGAIASSYSDAEPVVDSSGSNPDLGLHDLFTGRSSERGKAKVPKLTILNSSHVAPGDSAEASSILLFPDWKLVTNASPANARQLVATHLSPVVPPAAPFPPENAFRTRLLPYRAVVLLCSHKRRDKRCHIVAPILADAFISALHSRKVHVDDHGEALSVEGSDAIESWQGDEAEKAERWKSELAKAARGEDQEGEAGSVGVFRISHSGGHRYAGTCIVLFPSGASVWYGRVTPSDVPAIVEKTIFEGRVILDLFRGGTGVMQAEGKRCGILGW